MTKTILETPRLLLCEFIPEDADALARVLCDAETMRYYPRHFERRDADEWIARNLRRYEADGHGLWAVTLRESGDVIGDCGITLQEADGVLLPEIGYHLRRDQWGQGYATEAAQACRDWGFTQLSVAFLISLIRPENAPSRRVAERNGMVTWKQVTHFGLPHYVYRIDRATWDLVQRERASR
jgi:RimJ/RimL family protein N-acetyltransferase